MPIKFDTLFELDLPDAPDFVSIPSRISLDEAIMLNEATAKFYPQSMPTRQEQWDRKVFVEFVLK